MQRREFLKYCGVVGLSLIARPLTSLAMSHAKRENAKRPPNIVFIFADDMGWGDLGCYGHPHIKTPNLDQLARDGILFTQFYVNAPSCSPSRTGFMTGHFPARHGVHFAIGSPKINKSRDNVDFLDPKLHMVTRLVKQAGYVTGHFGKWHLGSSKDAPEPSSYGVDDYRIFNGNGPGWKIPDFASRSSELIIDESIRFIEANKDRPFYANVWLKDPHAVLDPTEEQMKPYEKYAPSGKVGKKYPGAMKIYYSVISNMDRHIGRLIKHIDQLDLANDTLIVFSSDNGPEVIAPVTSASHSAIGSTGPFRGRKRSIYEGGVRMPFIVRWPGHTPAGKVNNDTVVSGVDWLPTVCSLAGAELPEDYKPDGENMTDALLGKAKKRTRPLMWQYRASASWFDWTDKSPMLAIRDGKWKLLMNHDGSRIELYDIPNDPTELGNKAEQYPEIVERLSKILLDWQKTTPGKFIYPGGGSNAYPWPKSGDIE